MSMRKSEIDDMKREVRSSTFGNQCAFAGGAPPPKTLEKVQKPQKAAGQETPSAPAGPKKSGCCVKLPVT